MPGYRHVPIRPEHADLVPLALKALPTCAKRRMKLYTKAEGDSTMGNQMQTEGGHPAMDYAEHERTYARFIAFSKWGAISIAVLLLGMLFFLV